MINNTNTHLKLGLLFIGIMLMLGAIASPYITGIGAVVVFFLGWQMTEKSYESITEEIERVEKLKRKKEKEKEPTKEEDDDLSGAEKIR